MLSKSDIPRDRIQNYGAGLGNIQPSLQNGRGITIRTSGQKLSEDPAGISRLSGTLRRSGPACPIVGEVILSGLHQNPGLFHCRPIQMRCAGQVRQSHRSARVRYQYIKRICRCGCPDRQTIWQRHKSTGTRKE